MLRSKYHRPWQPRVSDSQLLNPSAHTTESEASFSDVVEEAEEQVPSPQSPETAASASSSSAAERIELPEAGAAENPRGKTGWYENLMGRFAKKH
jgi:hypothetical protein